VSGGHKKLEFHGREEKFNNEGSAMRPILVVAVAVISLLLGVSIGFAAKYKGAGIEVIRGKSDKDAGYAALTEAEHLANGGSWELIAVGRVYYLTGEKARGQALFDVVANGKAGGSDLERIADVYAEAGENDKASALYERMLAIEPKDDSSQALLGAWYMRIGQRERGEMLLGQALQRRPNASDYYLRAAESLLRVPAR
jgi:tetratricopeptide (TPR) repeat protein